MKKDYFLVIDTETSQPQKGRGSLVVDFAAVITDRKGRIYNQCAVLIHGVFGEIPLFYTSDESANNFFAKKNLKRRENNYRKMLKDGRRMLASVAAINRWLDKAANKYKPILTAYNLAFDRDACNRTGIDLTPFSRSFCLWHSAAHRFAGTKKYKRFILDNHYFRPRTEKGNMTYLTNAEIMAHYIKGFHEPEPHTALEDIIFFELPILCATVKGRPKKEILHPPKYDWEKYIVKDHFRVK